jgi:hypothetical protein
VTHEREKTPARGHNTVGMLKTLGTRLSSNERAPYDLPDHDDTVDFDEPTEDLIIDVKAGTISSEKKS